MLAGPLPETVNYRKLAQGGTRLEGPVPLVRMPRLLELLCAPDGELQAKLKFEFRKGKGKGHILTGKVAGEVKMECQRCLQPMTVMLDVNIRTWLMTDIDALLELPPEEDGLVVEGLETSIAGLIEDDLIVGLPMSALHDSSACSLDVGESLTAPPEVAPPVQEGGETHRPFADLASLLKKQ